MLCPQAVILAGGAGTRLKSVTGGKPKALAEVGGKPVIDHLIEAFMAARVRDFVLLLGVGADQVAAHVAAKWGDAIAVTIVTEEKPLGTGGAVAHALDRFAPSFFLCFGDVVFKTDLEAVRNGLGTHGGAMMTVHPNDHPADSDAVVCDDAMRVVSMSTAPHGKPVRNRVNAGIYAFDKTFLGDLVREENLLEVAKSDLEKDIVVPAIRRGRVHARELIEYLRDIGTPERLALGEADFAAGVPERLADPARRAGAFIRLSDLFELGPSPSVRPAATQALRSAIAEGYFPAVLAEEMPIAAEACDALLGAQGCFVWDYLTAANGRVPADYFVRRRLVAAASRLVALGAGSFGLAKLP